MADWTSDELRDLNALTAHGYSAARIGVLMGKTRDAVIGKWFRIREHDRSSNRRRSRSQRPSFADWHQPFSAGSDGGNGNG